MQLNFTNWILVVLLLLSLMAVLFVRVDNSQPNFQITFADDMTYSPAFRAYSPNESFANGRTLQAPVEGTIARGEALFNFAVTPVDAIRAGEELYNPVPDDQRVASVERGAAAFRTLCVSCHGGSGAGDGPVAKRGFPPPPSLLTGKSIPMKDGQLFHILTLGQNSMPAFAVQLTPARRWDVVNYIRSLQAKAPQVIEADTAIEPPIEETNTPSEAEAADVEQESEPQSQPELTLPATSETEPQP